MRRARVIARKGLPSGRRALDTPWIPGGSVALALVLWVAVVAVGGAVIALQSLGVTVAGRAWLNFSSPPMWWTAGIVGALCLAAALAARRARPAAVIPVTLAMGAMAPSSGAIATASVGALALTLAMVALSWLVGDAVLRYWRLQVAAPIVRSSIAVALGNGLLGLLLLALATLGWLNAATVAGAAALIVLALGLDVRRRLRLGAWQSGLRAMPILTWFETVVLGLATGIVAYALLATFVPENQSDAIRHHLPIAREIWQTGTAGVFPPMWTAESPIHAHLHYAVAYGLAGTPAVKLLHAFAGLTAVAAVAGIGWICAGRLAAIVGAAIFASLPVVLWEIGVAYVDLYPVMFTTAAALCVLCWQRDGRREWLVAAGALAGFGFAAKMTAGLMLAALAAAIVLVGREPWRWRDRVRDVATFALGSLTMLPWLLRSYVLTGEMPGVAVFVQHATGAATTDLPTFGLGRSPLDVISIPWAMTFQGELFHQAGAGDSGILLVMALPLALLAARTRQMRLLLVAAGLSYLAWVFTAQYTRYLLPTLAIAAAVAGVGVAAVLAESGDRARQLLARAVRVGVVAGLLAAPLLFLPDWKARLPIALFTGGMTASDDIEQEISAAAALAAATELLAPDTAVAYFGREQEGAQAYTEARLTYFGADPSHLPPSDILSDFSRLGADPDAILANFERLGIAYFIWNRAETDVNNWRAPLLSTNFLIHHTRILAGGRSGYLFEVLPSRSPGWGAGSENLLRDASFAAFAEGRAWEVTGRVRARRGDVSMPTRAGAIAQRVPVTAGSPYLLLATGQCADPAARSTLALRWFDAAGAELSVAADAVVPGVERSQQFLWGRAPEQAAVVSAEVRDAADCTFVEMALYADP
jgi:hypothetical protein